MANDLIDDLRMVAQECRTEGFNWRHGVVTRAADGLAAARAEVAALKKHCGEVNAQRWKEDEAWRAEVTDLARYRAQETASADAVIALLRAEVEGLRGELATVTDCHNWIYKEREQAKGQLAVTHAALAAALSLLSRSRDCVDEIAEMVSCTAPHKADEYVELRAAIDAAVAKGAK